MAAVFSLVVAISREFFAAISADKVIDGLLIDHVRMRVPPSHTALSRTEHLALFLLGLNKRCAAFSAHILVLIKKQILFPAVPSNGTPAHIQLIGDLGVALTDFSQFNDHGFLFLCHFLFSLGL